MSKGLFNWLEGELQAREKSPGLQMPDLLTLPEPERGLLNWMIRHRQVTFADLTAFLGQGEAHVHAILAELRDKGYVREIEIRGVTLYRVRLAPRRRRALPADLWAALEDKVEHEEEKGQ